MARRRAYSVDAAFGVASPTKTIISLTTGGTPYRPWIYDMWLGSSASPADNALTWFCQRTTAAGTGTTTPVPAPLDPGEAATPGTTVTTSCSGEPTYTAAKYLFHLALNQRASHRCQFDPDAPLQMPVTANNGIGLYAVHASFTGTVDACIHFAE